MAHKVTIVRVYDHDAEVPKTAYKVLVDRIWPRGVKKASLGHDDWCKDVTPSTELRKWYGHDPDKWSEFRDRYRTELAKEPASEALAGIADRLDKHPVVLYTAVKDVEISAAAVIEEILIGDAPLG